jgi:thiol:disulfide interchange protein
MHRAHPGRMAATCLPIVLAVLAGLLLVPASPSFGDPPQPKKKDTNARLKSRYATITTSVEPSRAKPGETVTFKVIAKIDPGFHIYKDTDKPKQWRSGPVYTTFDFFDTAGLKIEGEWAASKEAIKHKEPVWDELPFVEYYEDEVTWSIKLKIFEGTEPGKKVLRCQVGYMICNDKSCSSPGQWTLPDAELTVLPAQGSASKPAEPEPKKAAAAPTPTASSDPPKDSPTAASKEPAPTGTSATASTSPSPKPATTTTSVASNSASTPPLQSEVALKAREGLVPFLLFSAVGGLFALLMPCVWPMVPITVNFFVKQGHGKAGRVKTTGLAITYCLSIIGVFTTVGVLFSFFFSASALQTLANNFWINLFVATLFVVFGLSLLGLFEIRLPSFLLNASAQGEGRGGLIGVIFMALTLTITSFTCTFPVVGGLLVMAAGGNFFYPIIGLATFATVLSLPFLVLALSPGLISQMPRSGDWMNALKVVGGLIEIGAALKFVNTAELAYVTPENAWFNARVVLTSWTVLSAVCGLYLLGVFRTDHDHDEVKVGPGRLVFGAGFLGLALFLAPALFGHVPQSRVWDEFIVGLLPPDSTALAAPVAVVGEGNGASPGEVKATSNDPAQAEREEKKLHGVLWGLSFDQAREVAAAQNKPILIDFTGVNCANCRKMEQAVFPRPDVAKLMSKFVTVQLYTDRVNISSLTADQREERAELNQLRQLDMTQEATNPFYVVLSPSGEVIDKIGGYNAPEVFTGFLNKALEKLPEAVKVTQADSSVKPTRGDMETGQR